MLSLYMKFYLVEMLTANTDVEKANDETKEQLLKLVPTYESLATASKVHLIQSLVSRLLVDRIFNEYFIGLSREHAGDLSRVEEYLGEFGETLSHDILSHKTNWLQAPQRA